jgi:hypothetical protein
MRHALLDALIHQEGLKSDAALALELDYDVSGLSKIRLRKRGVSEALILRIHDYYGMPIARIRALIVEADSQYKRAA